MTILFNNPYVEKLYEGRSVSGKPKYSQGVILKFKKTVLMLRMADNIAEIRKFKGLNFEALKGDMKVFYSVRMDLQYRLILSLEKDELIVEEVLIIEDLTNHYK